MVFFSVFLELWTRAGVMPALTEVISLLLSLVGMPESLSTAIVGGLFEVTLGARYAGKRGRNSIAIQSGGGGLYIVMGRLVRPCPDH